MNPGASLIPTWTVVIPITRTLLFGVIGHGENANLRSMEFRRSNRGFQEDILLLLDLSWVDGLYLDVVGTYNIA